MRVVISTLFFLAVTSVVALGQKGFVLKQDRERKKAELFYDGKLLTAYCYFDSTEKPVLFPIKTLSGNTITRGYPISPRTGERTDHPHHVGLWFNYESVNGLDFWNNSSAIPQDRKHLYGSIKHREIVSTNAQGDHAELVTVSHWVDNSGRVLLEERTRFIFRRENDSFIIDRLCTLTGVAEEVLFKDVKDGMLGLRVARQLEMPSRQEDNFVDAQGNVTAVKKLDNEGVSGLYINREGVKGDDTWAKRSVWTCLHGEKDGEQISIAIIDHPENVGYPTYWHARGYGLFAANPLGQKVFSEGKEELNFKIQRGKVYGFKYRVIIHHGSALNATELDRHAGVFSKIK
jgi:hypothetical protein